MARFDGSLARMFDFGSFGSLTTTMTQSPRPSRAALRLAPRGHGLSGPDKYKALDHRRRQAQIKARRLLDLLDAEG